MYTQPDFSKIQIRRIRQRDLRHSLVEFVELSARFVLSQVVFLTCRCVERAMSYRARKKYVTQLLVFAFDTNIAK